MENNKTIRTHNIKFLKLKTLVNTTTTSETVLQKDNGVMDAAALDFILSITERYQARYINAEQAIMHYLNMRWYQRIFKGHSYFLVFMTKLLNTPD